MPKSPSSLSNHLVTAAIFLTLPEEVREGLLAEHTLDKQGIVAASADSEDTIESLRAKVTALTEENIALKKENFALKEAAGKKKGKGSKVFPSEIF